MAKHTSNLFRPYQAPKDNARVFGIPLLQPSVSANWEDPFSYSNLTEEEKRAYSRKSLMNHIRKQEAAGVVKIDKTYVSPKPLNEKTTAVKDFQEKNKSTFVDPIVETETEAGTETGTGENTQYGPGAATQTKTQYTPHAQDLLMLLNQQRGEYDKRAGEAFSDSGWQIGDNIMNTLGLLTGLGQLVNRTDDNKRDWYRRQEGVSQDDIQRMDDLDFMIGNADKMQSYLNQNTYENADAYNTDMGAMFDNIIKNAELRDTIKNRFQGIDPVQGNNFIAEGNPTSTSVSPDFNSLFEQYQNGALDSNKILSMINSGEIDGDSLTDEQLKLLGIKGTIQ